MGWRGADSCIRVAGVDTGRQRDTEGGFVSQQSQAARTGLDLEGNAKVPSADREFQIAKRKGGRKNPHKRGARVSCAWVFQHLGFYSSQPVLWGFERVGAARD